ncbi:MAG: hypothetical protein IIB60_04400 [Planctomycetes bacterium]|nr:hypothetical protein [Planctomycetota bacterium]
MKRRLPGAGGLLLGLAAIGCAGDARVELAAADAIDRLAQGLEVALQEYHDDLAQADSARGRMAVGALVNRLRGGETNKVSEDDDAHAADFLNAMQRLHADREVAWQRYWASVDNVKTLQEIAQGLRRLAIDSLSLRDEANRYVQELIEMWSAARVRRGSGASD